jgi:hypothetical protein
MEWYWHCFWRRLAISPGNSLVRTVWRLPSARPARCRRGGRLHDFKVRPEPAHRVALYLDVGFQEFGKELTEEINGIQTEFIQMEIRPDRFKEMDEESV